MLSPKGGSKIFQREVQEQPTHTLGIATAMVVPHPRDWRKSSGVGGAESGCTFEQEVGRRKHFHML